MTSTILIVDDQDSVRELVSIIVRSAGYEVIEAVDGKDALDRLDGKNVEMVITDLRMPNMDGLELVKHLRARSDHRSTPVIILSSEFLEPRRREAQEAGVSDWITKPFLRHQLLKSIRRAAANNDSYRDAADLSMNTLSRKGE